MQSSPDTTAFKQPSAFTPKPHNRQDWAISGCLFLGAFAVRLLYAVQFKFPPLDDPAYYIQAARSLFSPQPWQISIIWNFQPRFAAVLHPALDYWQPLPAFAIAGSFLIFGQSLWAAQLPSLVAGACLPVFTFWLGRKTFAFLPDLPETTNYRLSLVAAIFVLANPLLIYQSTFPDSSMLYSALIVAALWLWGDREKQRWWQAFGFGLLTGLAYLARTPAVFLMLAWLTLILWQFWKKSLDRPRWQNILLAIVGVGLPVSLWSLRNLLVFGFITSPAGLQTIFIFDYQSLFNYQTPVNLQTFLAGGIGQIVGIRLEALGQAWSQGLDFLFFPTVLPAGAGLIWLVIKSKRILIVFSAWYSLLLLLGLPLIFGVASINGSYYHSIGSSAPCLAVGLIYGGWWVANWVRRRRLLRTSLAPILILLLAILTLFKAIFSLSGAVSVQNNEGQTFSEISTWLQQHPSAAVITNEPSSLNYAANVSAIRLPANENLEVLSQVASYYHAGYIIITETAGQYPALLDSPANHQFPLVYRAANDSFEIYRVNS